MIVEKLKGKIADSLLAEIPIIEAGFKIQTPLRIAHFLAQCAHESGDFKKTTENLNYSSESLKKIFPKYFPGETSKAYHRQPEKIANHIYATRMGNGDTLSGDGWKYRGRGYIQLTGKTNYVLLGKSLKADVVANPDLVAIKYPLTSAAWFFYANDIISVADKGDTVDAIVAVRKRVNGGTIGLDDCIKKFNLFYSLLK